MLEPKQTADDDLDKKNKTIRVKLCYNLTSSDIFRLIFKIHGMLLILPVAFLAGFIAITIGGLSKKGEVFFYCLILVLSILGISYIFLSQYFLFKKQYCFFNQDIKYQVEISNAGLRIYQDAGKNLTDYVWGDFIKCSESKNTVYLYFKYDRALILKKQQFIEGTVEELRSLIKTNINKFKEYQK